MEIIDALPKIKVAYMSKSPVIREAISSALEHLPGIAVVAQFHTTDEGLESLHDLEVDVILTGDNPPRLDPIRLAAAMGRNGGRVVPVVVMTAFARPRSVIDIIRSPVSAYLSDEIDLTTLWLALHAASRGLTILDPDTRGLARYYLSTHLSDSEPLVQESHLSARESQVMELMVHGRSNKQIAGQLDISQRTVHVHVAHILEKLHVHSRTQAVLKAVEVLSRTEDLRFVVFDEDSSPSKQPQAPSGSSRCDGTGPPTGWWCRSRLGPPRP